MIFTLGFGSVISLINILKKKSPFFTLILILFMWTLFGWSSNTADYEFHRNKYYNSDGNILVEPIYSFLSKLFKMFGFQYEQFLIITSGIMFIFLYIIIKKQTNRSAFMIGLYFIFPFVFNVVIFRFSIGMFFSYWGIYHLINERKNSKAILYSIIFFVLAGLTHFSLLILLVMLLIRFLSVNKIIILVSIADILIYALLKSSVLLSSLKMLEGNILLNKVSYVLNATPIGLAKIRIIQVLIFFIVFVIMYFILKRYVDSEFSLKILKMNILIMIIVPILWLNSDMYRVQLVLILYNYFFIDKALKNSTPKIYYKSNILITMGAIVYALILLWMYVFTNEVWINNVFKAIFENNLLW